MVAVDPEVPPQPARQPRQVRARAHQDRRVAHRAGGEDQDLALDLLRLPGRLPARVLPLPVEDRRLDDVAVTVRRGAADALHLPRGPHDDAGVLGGAQVVRVDRVLRAVDAARVAPLDVLAQLEVDRARDAVAGVAGGVQRRRPQAAGLRHLVPARPLHAQRQLGTAVVRVERLARDLLRPHPPLGAVVGVVVAALEGLARRADARGEVQVRAAADSVRDHYLGARPLRGLDQAVDVREVADVHRLLEVGVLEARPALEHEDVLRVHVRRAVELGEPPRGDRAAEAGPDDADVDALGHRYFR